MFQRTLPLPVIIIFRTLGARAEKWNGTGPAKPMDVALSLFGL